MILFSLLAAACGKPLAPLVPVRPAAEVLSGTFVRAVDSTPLGGARVELICCLGPGGRRDTVKTLTSNAGAFRFTGLAPARYLLRGAAIGFQMRLDTVILGAGPAPRLEIPMVLAYGCLGSCLPDPALVAAARARRSEWGCDRDRDNVREKKAAWIAMLASDTGVRPKLGITMSPRDVPGLVRRITDRSLCRKAAELYDRWGTIASLEYTLFRFGRLILMSPADESMVFLVLDQKFVEVANFSVPQE